MILAIAVAVAAAACGIAARPLFVGPRRSVGADTTEAALVEPAESTWAALLDTTAAEVRAGHSLHIAFRSACERQPPAGRALTPATSLSQVPTLVSPDPDEAVAIQTISVASTLGGPTATVLESGASLLRERAAVRAEAGAHAAQARLSARVLTAVPLVFAAWSCAASPSFRAAVFSPAGSAAAVGGLLCNVAGWWWMRSIVARAHR